MSISDQYTFILLCIYIYFFDDAWPRTLTDLAYQRNIEISVPNALDPKIEGLEKKGVKLTSLSYIIQTRCSHLLNATRGISQRIKSDISTARVLA